MKKILIALTTVFLTTQSASNITSYFNSKANQTFFTNNFFESESSFWDKIDRNKLAKDVQAIWDEMKEKPTLKEVSKKTEEYLEKREDNIQKSADIGSHFHALEMLDQAFADLENLKNHEFLKFFNLNSKRDWINEFNRIIATWEEKFEKLRKEYSTDNEDGYFYQLDDILGRVYQIENTLENYIHLGQEERLNYQERDIATEQKLEEVINQYDITLRDFGVLVARYPDLNSMKISLETYRKYKFISNAIHFKLNDDLNYFVNIFLQNVERRMETLNKAIDNLKNNDTNYKDFENLHHRYLDYKKEIDFLEQEHLFQKTPAILTKVQGIVLKLRKHFNDAGKSMANAFKNHFDKIEKSVKEYTRTITSEESWKELEKLNFEYTSAKAFFETMKREDSDLALNYSDIEKSVHKVHEAIKLVRFVGFDKIRHESDGIYFEVSNDTWMTILGYRHKTATVATTVIGVGGGTIGAVKWGSKTFQIFGKTFQGGSKLVRFGAGFAGSAIGSVLGFIFLELPFIILNSIETNSTGGTFYLPYSIFASALFLPALLLAVTTQISDTFEIQKLKTLD